MMKQVRMAEASGRLRMNAAQNNSTRETPGEVVKRNDGRESDGEHQRAALIAKSAGIGDPIAKRGAECLRDGDRGPIKRFDLRRLDRVHID
jgi:hypothetical protein